MKIGPRSREQLNRLAKTWKQGEHVLISGATGSGKTLLARHVDQVRIDRGGHVIVFVCKLRPDETIVKEYAGFTRWKRFKKNPPPYEDKVLLMPDTKGLNNRDALEVQKTVFSEAMDELSKIGRWTIHVDEGLYFCNPSFLGFGDELAMMHAMGRASKLSLVTLTQRPSHIPLIIYSSASHAFIGRTREHVDAKRLSELGGRTSAKELVGRINANGRHDFLWIPVAPDWVPETVNLRR